MALTVMTWSALSAIILAIIIVPFLFLGVNLEAWTNEIVESADKWDGAVAVTLGILLASDVLLPVPSSIVSSAAGALFGFIGGTAISVLGMTASSLIGYWLGMSAGRNAAHHLVGERELSRLEEAAKRYGLYIVVLFRAVPILAEASVLFAGMSRMPFTRFLVLVVISNLGISAAYAGVGAYAAELNSFLLAFAGAILIPLAVIALVRMKLLW